jgi:hypothetical protein
MVLVPSLRLTTEKETDVREVTSSLGDSATFCMIADFPTPAAPTTQRILFSPLQWEIKYKHCSRTAKRVPG